MSQISFCTTVANRDYEIPSDVVFIPKCEKRVCQNVTILDDTQLELVEMFEITLERSPALQGNIRIMRERSLARITIIDTDSNVLKLCILG